MLTKKELADKMNVSVSTIDRRMNAGMPYIKHGDKNSAVRFVWTDVMDWLKGVKK